MTTRLWAGLAAVCLSIATATAIVSFASAPLAAALEFDRDAILAGEAWRLVTGHLTHWSWEHVFWDLALFVALAGVALRARPRATLLTLLISPLWISAGLWLWQPELVLYRGLSGVDSALFALVCVSLLGRCETSALRVLAAALAFGFMCKLGFEFRAGETLFVDASRAGFVAVPLAHLLGAVLGCALGSTQWLAAAGREERGQRYRSAAITSATSSSVPVSAPARESPNRTTTRSEDGTIITV